MSFRCLPNRFTSWMTLFCLIVAVITFLFGAMDARASVVYAPEMTVTVRAVVTAYTSSPDETDDTPFETAAGTRTRDGVVACPPKYDFGTQVVIGGRRYVCEDRMSRRYWNEERWDVWRETKEEAREWGVKELAITIWKT